MPLSSVGCTPVKRRTSAPGEIRVWFPAPELPAAQLQLSSGLCEHYAHVCTCMCLHTHTHNLVIKNANLKPPLKGVSVVEEMSDTLL